MKKQLIIAMIGATVFATPAFAMDDDNEDHTQKITKKEESARTNRGEIEFQNERKPALGFIMRALLNPLEDPFSVTEIVRYEPTKGFMIKGTVCTACKEDLQEISKGNFVFTPFYKVDKTHISPSTYQNVGAFIVGTSDQELAHNLHFAHMRNLVKQIKQ